VNLRTCGSVVILIIVSLTGCATPVVMLQHAATGQVARCGGGTAGSMAGGLIGYNIERSGDERCVKDYEAKGFKRLP
jgi:hypothetical protein